MPTDALAVLMRLLRVAALLLGLLATAPASVHAGSAEDPEVTDPRGDAGPVPSPAGFDWADITALWFEEADRAEGGGGVRLTIQVAALEHDPPGEVGAHFRVGDAWWLAGWTTIVFPAPPFSHVGGFYCPADADGKVPDSSLCGGLEAVAGVGGDDRFTALLPSETFGFAPGTAIDEPRGYAVDVVSAQADVQGGWIEVTEKGRSFTLAAPGVEATPKDSNFEGGTGGAADDATLFAGDEDGGGAQQIGRGRDAPGAAPLLAFLALAFAALVRRVM